MTQRKPHAMQFETFVDRQIREAQEAGAFDDLPGAGKPIPNHGDDPNWWLRSYLDREGLSGEALLPESLQLRREFERLPAEAAAAVSEDEVRELAAEFNRRVAEYIRFPTPPQVPIRKATVDELLEHRRATRPRRR